LPNHCPVGKCGEEGLSRSLELSVADLVELVPLLTDAFAASFELRLAIHGLKRDVSLSQLGGDKTPHGEIILNLLERAERDGWLAECVRGLLRACPQHRPAQDWAARSGLSPAAASGGMPAVGKLHFSFFDLDPIKAGIKERPRTPDETVVGFAIPRADTMVGEVVCEWLERTVRPTVKASLLSIGPFVEPDLLIAQASAYRSDLAWQHVACPIVVNGADAGMIDTFWRGVRAALAGVSHSLTLIFTGDDQPVFPEAVTVLETPRMSIGLVEAWLSEVAVLSPGLPDVVASWREYIEVTATLSVGLDPRRVYEGLRDSLAQAQSRPDTFPLWLTERIAHAKSAD
jgi:hypothetical protein